MSSTIHGRMANVIRYGSFFLLLFSVASLVHGAGLLRSDLERLLALPPGDLPRALQVESIYSGPILDATACPGGLMVIETRGVRRFDSTGRGVWNTAIPEGVLRHTTPRSGRWLAGYSAYLDKELNRVSLDWLLNSEDGSRRVLSRDSHSSSTRRTDRKLLAWDPLPFPADSGDEEMEMVFQPTVPSPPTPEPETEPAPSSIGYRRSHRTLAFLLSEGLLSFRTTHFLDSGRSWWSLYHFDPESGLGSKVCDGTPGFSETELASLLPHGSSREHFLLRQGGRSKILDPRGCRIYPSEEAEEEILEVESNLTVGEVYHLEPGGPGGGVSLVHPEGRLPLALQGHSIERLILVPGSTALFAVERSRKISLIPDERHKTLYLIELGRVEERLAWSLRAREYQEAVNQTLQWIDRGPKSPLDLTILELKELEEKLSAPAPSEVLETQALRALAQARIMTAERLIQAQGVTQAREILARDRSSQSFLARLQLDLKKFPEHLPGDLVELQNHPEHILSSPDLLVEKLRALIRLGRSQEAQDHLLEAARRAPRHPLLAALAVLLGDRARNAGEDGVAEVDYRLALQLKPTSLGAARKLMRTLSDGGRGCQAAEVLAQISRKKPDSDPGGLRAELFQSYLECGDLKEARGVLDGLRLDRPLNLQFLEWDADLLVREGTPQLALPKLHALLRLSPDSPRLRSKLEALEALEAKAESAKP